MKKALIILFLISMIACRQADTKKATKSDKTQVAANGWNLFDKPDYTIKYPSAWELKEGGEMSPSFFLSPLESNDDNFRENVNILVEDLSGKKMDLETYTKFSENQIMTMLKNGKMIESTKIKNDSTSYRKLIYISDQGIYNLQFEQYYFIHNEKAYILTLTTEQKKVKAFKETGEKILNSFTLKTVK